MAEKPNSTVVLVAPSFNYSALDSAIANRLRIVALRIREKIKKTLEDIIQIGKELIVAKETLTHGRFHLWLRAEFGWSERMAQNFMLVAQQFGPKTEIIADLAIQPTAAYLLAAPSVPEQARQAALQKAEEGEKITVAVARKIIVEAKTVKKKATELSAEKFGFRLMRVLERYRVQWNPKELVKLARQLRELADQLEKPLPNGKQKARVG